MGLTIETESDGHLADSLCKYQIVAGVAAAADALSVVAVADKPVNVG